MRVRSFLSSLLLASVCCPCLALAAPARDVKVCVRIEQKSWTRDGARKEAAPTRPAPAQPVSVPAEPAPQSESPAAVPPAAAFAEAGVPGVIETVPPPVPVRRPAFPIPTLGDDAASKDDLVTEEEAELFSVDPDLYLRRLIEYHVTHEPGFESVREGCSQTLSVELYPVRRGFTVFARYSGSAREEKVDVVRLDELGTFAERVTLALLRDRSISETLTRTTVLRADSEARVRQIQTRTHFLLGMGSGVRFGRLPTAPNDTDPAATRLRAETPLGFTVGARNKFRAWALDATGRLQFGMTERASRRNAGGGHVDYSVGLGLGLGFLSYANPDGVNTLYYGGGGSFELSRYQTLARVEQGGYQPSPDGLWGGGLNVDAILGYEFMRTSTLHFFVQGMVSAPAYVFESENQQSRVQSYIPSGQAQVGLLF